MRPPRPKLFVSLLLPFALGAICTVASYLAAGATAGLFFGGFVFATLLAPVLALRTDAPLDHLLSSTALIAGISSIWAAAVALESDLTTAHWLACSLILTCCAAALCGAASCLRSFRVPAVAAATLVTLVGILWLTWPIWLSPALAGNENTVAWLTPAHPLLAIDKVTSLGSPWTEHRLMYNQFSILNQDVAYQLPSTILWTCALHGFFGVVLIGVAAFRRGADAAATSAAPIASC